MNTRPAGPNDVEFLKKMLYEAAAWKPDWPREQAIQALADPILERYHRGWGRPGDVGVIAEIQGEAVGAAWFRLFTVDEPGHGYVDERTPELGIAVLLLYRRKGIGEPPARAHVRGFAIMVERGVADSDVGRTISNEEMARRIETWRR